MLLDSPFDLASSYICHLIPSKIVIVPEEELKDMAKGQIDQPYGGKKDMEARCHSRMKLVLKILKGHLLSHIF
jgi:hypothetical protein